MALSRCRECRRVVSDEAASCPGCGVPEPARANDLAVPDVQEASASSPERIGKDKQKVAIGLLVVAVLVGSAFLLDRRDESDGAATEDTAAVGACAAVQRIRSDGVPAQMEAVARAQQSSDDELRGYAETPQLGTQNLLDQRAELVTEWCQKHR